MKQSRLTRLQQEMTRQQIDCIALVPGPNMVYLSGIHSHLSERPIILFLPAQDEPAIIIPNLEAMKAADAGVPQTRIFGWSDDEGYANAFAQAATQLQLNTMRLGVEALHMRVLELDLLRQAAPGLQTVHAEPVLMSLRAVKEAEELEAMQKAIHIAEAAIEKLLPQIKIGMTEKQIAALLTQYQLDGGAEGIAFGPIVSAGPNGASPHAVPTDRPIQQGDLLVIDWGCLVDGYPSDITRTFAVGEIDAEARRIYELTRQANEAGIAVAQPGATGDDVDTAARKVIEAGGYGRYFIHRTGHGLGVEGHEPPFMMPGNHESLVEGNVFTVEPGIYLPGRNGVRIEDNIVITATGNRCMTSLTKELITVG